MTATTGDHLLRAVAANPDEDTPRLLYADWLEELPAVRVRCPVPSCGNPAKGWDGFYRCRTCRGTGEVLDTSNANRAEFIRVQCELALLPECEFPCEGKRCDQTFRSFSISCRACEGRRRADELLAAHPEWSRQECPACVGEGLIYEPWGDDAGRVFPNVPGRGQSFVCRTCYGTGDLLWRPDRGEWRPTFEGRPVTFSRGFIDSVGCTLAEAFAPDGTPTPWARAVCEMLPLTRFVISDRTTGNADTDAGAGPFGGRVWWCDNYRTWPNPPHQLPVLLFDAIDAPAEMGDAGKNPPRVKVFPTRAAATDALARAACRVVRAAGLSVKGGAS